MRWGQAMPNATASRSFSMEMARPRHMCGERNWRMARWRLVLYNGHNAPLTMFEAIIMYSNVSLNADSWSLKQNIWWTSWIKCKRIKDIKRPPPIVQLKFTVHPVSKTHRITHGGRLAAVGYEPTPQHSHLHWSTLWLSQTLSVVHYDIYNS